MAKKKRLPEVLACFYCRKFQYSSHRRGGGTLRMCEFIKKETTNTSTMDCEGFELYQYIFCDKRHARYSYEICARCNDCSTGAFIQEYIKRNPMPTFAAVAKSNPKPSTRHKMILNEPEIDEKPFVEPCAPITVRTPKNGSQNGTSPSGTTPTLIVTRNSKRRLLLPVTTQ